MESNVTAPDDIPFRALDSLSLHRLEEWADGRCEGAGGGGGGIAKECQMRISRPFEPYEQGKSKSGSIM